MAEIAVPPNTPEINPDTKMPYIQPLQIEIQVESFKKELNTILKHIIQTT